MFGLGTAAATAKSLKLLLLKRWNITVTDANRKSDYLYSQPRRIGVASGTRLSTGATKVCSR